MVKTRKYPAGFMLLSNLAIGGFRTYHVAAAVTIAKGDALQDNGAGYAQLGTALASTFLGIAVEDVDNSAGAAGALDVQVIPPLASLQFIVPVEANALITQTAVGTVCDLETEDGIDISDTTVTANGFFIEDIDVSTAAIAANTYGYAIGHFTAVT